MTTTTTSVLRYWRNCLADIDRLGIDVANCHENNQFPIKELSFGQISPERAQQFFKKRMAQEIDNIKNKDIPIEVIVAPYVAKRNIEHGQREQSHKQYYKTICPLLIPALLYQNGNLKPKLQLTLPWIDRTHLEPTDADTMILGELNKVDEFETRFSLAIDQEENIGWQELWQYAMDLFNFSSKSKEASCFQDGDYLLMEYGYITLPNQMKNTSKQIIALYDQLNENRKDSATNTLPKLLTSYLSLDTVNEKPCLSTLEIIKNSRDHLGYLDSENALTYSQREALSHFHELIDGDILAINGPPGTGKTTLLQSVITSLWVKAAIEKSSPPIIVTASTNNLAVTNVLDNLSKLHGNNTLEKRWLPNINSLALYLCSSGKVKIAQQAHYIYGFTKSGTRLNGKIMELYEADYHEMAEEHFLKEFNTHYKCQEKSLDAATATLHNTLKETHNRFIHLHCAITQLTEIHKQGGVNELNSIINKSQNNVTTLNSTQEKWERIYQKWLSLQMSNQFKWGVLTKIPVLKIYFLNQQNLTIKQFSAQNPELHELPLDIILLTKHIEKKCREIRQNLKQNTEALQTSKTKLSEYNQHIELWKEFLDNNTSIDIDTIEDFSIKHNPLNILDTTLRNKMFLLALHYWEATWLSKTKPEFDINGTGSFDFTGRKAHWQYHAMLFPCFVTTMQSGVKFFKFRNGPDDFRYATDIIDLLIIDEAGQVSPALAGGMLALAKRALFVGDCKQLEPIVNLPQSLDYANAKAHHLCADYKSYQNLTPSGTLMSGSGGHAFGNAMQIAQRRCTYRKVDNHDTPYPERGLFLLEHWRCVPDIIQYCNRLAYAGHLKAMRSNNLDFPFPAIGYAHIKGIVSTSGRSKKNNMEAEVIVQWIKDNKEKLQACYPNEPLSNIIGIITPFSAQKRTLQRLLKKNQLEIEKVGTVHALQGAERPVVLFSSVYCKENMENQYFFDQGVNMLNVAVSRAKESFLVFGDMDIFDPTQKTPSGLLAKHLFASADNEMTGIITPERKNNHTQNIELLNTRIAHREILQSSFERAQQQLVIVSPYLSIHALKGNNIQNILEKQKVIAKIIVYTDVYLNCIKSTSSLKNVEWKPNAYNALILLKKLNIDIRLTRNVHSKIICIDSETFIEGSYNWLSAVTDDHSKYANHESSLAYCGNSAKEFIDKTLNDLRERECEPHITINNTTEQ